MIRPLLALAALALSLSPAAALELETVTLGEQTLEGVLVRWEGGLRLMIDAGTPGESAYVVRPKDGSPAVAQALTELAVERQAPALVGKERVERRESGLFVPVREAPENPYPAKLFRKYHGVMTPEAEFHVDKVVAPERQLDLEKLLPLAMEQARQVVQSSGKQELDFAFTLLERTGTLEAILLDVAPLLQQAGPAD